MFCHASNSAKEWNFTLTWPSSKAMPRLESPTYWQRPQQPSFAKSGQSPAQLSSAAQHNVDSHSTSGAASQFASISTLASIANISNVEGSAQPSVSHPTYTGPIIKHIPRSARQHIAAELSTVLSHICSKPDDVSNWSTLLEFGSVMLRAPPRAGRRHNLASVLNKRSVFSTQTAPFPPQQTADHQPRKKMSGDQSLATTVMSKIEDGNIKAAIRIIYSGDSPAVYNDNYCKKQMFNP